MTLSEFWQYCRYSTFQLTFNLNPLHWIIVPIYLDTFSDKFDEYNLKVSGFHFKLFFLRLSLQLTNGVEFKPEEDKLVDNLDQLEIDWEGFGMEPENKYHNDTYKRK